MRSCLLLFVALALSCAGFAPAPEGKVPAPPKQPQGGSVVVDFGVLPNPAPAGYKLHFRFEARPAKPGAAPLADGVPVDVAEGATPTLIRDLVFDSMEGDGWKVRTLGDTKLVVEGQT